MSLFSELESIKYYFILDLIKHNEVYDKKRKVLTGQEVFELCQTRYDLMQELLLPLKQKLGENIEIVDIGFAKGMQDNTSIVVMYKSGDKHNYFTISDSGINDIEVTSSDNRLERHGFILANKKIIIDIFKCVYENSLDSEFYINSTSKKFVITDNCKSFNIKDAGMKLFSLEGSHSLYDQEGLMYNMEKTMSAYSRLKEILSNEDNILDIYNHIHVYEDDFPKVLIKKTNR